jgi:hypothetical protein
MNGRQVACICWELRLYSAGEEQEKAFTQPQHCQLTTFNAFFNQRKLTTQRAASVV